MADKKVNFQLTFPENLKKDIVLSSTPNLAFDDLGDFIEERERIRRLLESANEATLKVDYSDFANHVFFDSAVSKYQIAQARILTKYPYNGNTEEKDAFFLTSSGYENNIYDQWPRHVGYLRFSGSTNTFFSASDYDKKLVFGTSSLMLSADVRKEPDAGSEGNNIIAIQSGSTASNALGHIRMFFSGGGAGPISLISQVSSGSTLGQTVVSYDAYAYSGSWHNIAAVYDRSVNILSTYIDGNRVISSSIIIGPIEQNTVFVIGGGGTGYASLSGAIDNVRLYFTASELLLQKHINKPIDSEDYLVLNYKFNEGVVGTSSVDLNVVDYSKSALHALIAQYSPEVRVSGSSRMNDPGDPILYSFHSGVLAFSGTNVLSASDYDRENNNQIFNMIPEYILQADENQEGLMISLSLALARFFDELKLYIDQFDNLRVTNYDDIDETPDIFLPFLTRYFGWKVTEHFGDTNPLSFFFGEGVQSSGSLEVPLLEIRNQFWRRTLNNLPYLLKTKGKRYNIDAFFNVLGVNKENINLKEYGYLPGGSISDTRIHKEKVASFLGIGTGSLSSSFVKVPSLISGANNSYTVEAFLQLPYQSASYSASLSVLTGSVWQLVDPNQVTGSIALLWNVPHLGSTEGKFILTGSTAAGASQVFSSSLVEVFDGDFVYIAAGLKANQIPFIEIRTLDNDSLDFTGSFTGSVALSGVFTGSNYDFIMGATSGTFFQKQTQGYFGEFRYWNRPLSSSEFTDHAFNFQSVGLNNPAEAPNPLRGHWPLGENKLTDAAGNLNSILDLSRNNRIATGTLFPASYNPYKKFLIEYNHLSPSIDLKWTENKVRIRNKTELKIGDVANDTNEVSLEFNLIDSLNKDITKIFSTFDLFNNAIGSPVNKYRDEYADLEAYRRVYFDRLGDSIHFNQFFGLFKWFDKKISDAIKQLLPTRVKFIGGEQVVESHFLERPRYQYKYPIFRTPVDIPNAELSGAARVDGKSHVVLPNSPPANFIGTHAAAQQEMQYLNALRSVNTQLVGGPSGSLLFDSGSANAGNFQAIAVDVSGAIYAVGSNGGEWIASKSHLSSTLSWVTVDSTSSDDGQQANGIALDQVNGRIYVVGHQEEIAGVVNIVVRRSTDKGATWTTVLSYDSGSQEEYGFAVDTASDGSRVIVVGETTQEDGWIILSSSTGDSGSWARVDLGSGGDPAQGQTVDVKFSPTDPLKVYALGQRTVGTINQWVVKSSSLGGLTGSWAIVDTFQSALPATSGVQGQALLITGSSVFVFGYESGPGQTKWVTRRSSTGASGTWSTVDTISHSSSIVGPKSAQTVSGAIFVGGFATGAIYGAFIVRASYDGGNEWNNVVEVPIAAGFTNVLIEETYVNSFIPNTMTTGSVLVFGQLGIGNFNNGAIKVDVSLPTTSTRGVPVAPRQSLVDVFGDTCHCSISQFSDGAERIDRQNSKYFLPYFSQSYFSATFNDASQVAIDPSGNIYLAVGRGTPTGGWWLRKAHITASKQSNWSFADNRPFTVPAAVARGIAFDTSGAIYVCGNGNTGAGDRFTIRKSHMSANTTWNTAFTDAGIEGSGAQAQGIMVDSGDNLYCWGHSVALTQSANWIIRKSIDRGTSWSTLFSGSGSNFTTNAWDRCTEVRIAPNGNFYAIGWEETPSEAVWVTRKSVDDGATWNIMDYFAAPTFSGAVPYSMEFSGNAVFVAGGMDLQEPQTWGTSSAIASKGIVRASYDTGSTWSEILRDELSTAQFARGFGIIRNINSRLYIGGHQSLYVSDTGLSGSFVSIGEDVGLSSSEAFPAQQLGKVTWRSISVAPNGQFFMAGNVPAGGAGPGEGQSEVVVTLISESIPRDGFSRMKVSGDDANNSYNTSTDINSKNEFARRILLNRDRNNE